MKQTIREEIRGITEESKKFVQKNLRKVGEVIEVAVQYDKENCFYRTTIVGEKKDIEVTGFSVGYCGEGPSGMIWLLVKLNMQFEEEQVYSTDGKNAGYILFKKKSEGRFCACGNDLREDEEFCKDCI